MDTGEGRFFRYAIETTKNSLREKYPKSKGVFEVGEVLEIKGSRFKVKQINTFGIKLKLLKQS